MQKRGSPPVSLVNPPTVSTNGADFGVESAPNSTSKSKTEESEEEGEDLKYGTAVCEGKKPAMPATVGSHSDTPRKLRFLATLMRVVSPTVLSARMMAIDLSDINTVFPQPKFDMQGKSNLPYVGNLVHLWCDARHRYEWFVTNDISGADRRNQLRDAAEMFKFFEKTKADFNQPDSWGYTPLMWAATTGNEGALECLLDRQHSLRIDDVVNIENYDPIHLALANGQHDAAQLLMRRYPKIILSLQKTTGDSVLHLMVRWVEDQTVDSLLLARDQLVSRGKHEWGMLREKRNFVGLTPLLEAAKQGSFACLEFFIRNGSHNVLVTGEGMYKNKSALELSCDWLRLLTDCLNDTATPVEVYLRQMAARGISIHMSWDRNHLKAWVDEAEQCVRILKQWNTNALISLSDVIHFHDYRNPGKRTHYIAQDVIQPGYAQKLYNRRVRSRLFALRKIMLPKWEAQYGALPHFASTDCHGASGRQAPSPTTRQIPKAPPASQAPLTPQSPSSLLPSASLAFSNPMPSSESRDITKSRAASALAVAYKQPSFATNNPWFSDPHFLFPYDDDLPLPLTVPSSDEESDSEFLSFSDEESGSERESNKKSQPKKSNGQARPSSDSNATTIDLTDVPDDPIEMMSPPIPAAVSPSSPSPSSLSRVNRKRKCESPVQIEETEESEDRSLSNIDDVDMKASEVLTTRMRVAGLEVSENRIEGLLAEHQAESTSGARLLTRRQKRIMGVEVSSEGIFQVKRKFVPNHSGIATRRPKNKFRAARGGSTSSTSHRLTRYRARFATPWQHRPAHAASYSYSVIPPSPLEEALASPAPAEQAEVAGGDLGDATSASGVKCALWDNLRATNRRRQHAQQWHMNLSKREQKLLEKHEMHHRFMAEIERVCANNRVRDAVLQFRVRYKTFKGDLVPVDLCKQMLNVVYHGYKHPNLVPLLLRDTKDPARKFTPADLPVMGLALFNGPLENPRERLLGVRTVQPKAVSPWSDCQPNPNPMSLQFPDLSAKSDAVHEASLGQRDSSSNEGSDKKKTKQRAPRDQFVVLRHEQSEDLMRQRLLKSESRVPLVIPAGTILGQYTGVIRPYNGNGKGANRSVDDTGLGCELPVTTHVLTEEDIVKGKRQGLSTPNLTSSSELYPLQSTSTPRRKKREGHEGQKAYSVVIVQQDDKRFEGSKRWKHEVMVDGAQYLCEFALMNDFRENPFEQSHSKPRPGFAQNAELFLDVEVDGWPYAFVMTTEKITVQPGQSVQLLCDYGPDYWQPFVQDHYDGIILNLAQQVIVKEGLLKTKSDQFKKVKAIFAQYRDSIENGSAH